MSSAGRAALIVLAVAVLGIGFVVAQGGDEADTPTTSVAATQSSTPETTVSTGTGTGTGAVPSTTGTTATSTPVKPAAPATPLIRIKDGEPVGGVKKLSFDKGDTVRFRVESDVADHVHVHGYDLMKDVAADGKASFSFKGDIDGIFEIELEDAGVEIASLKVTP
ncbi:hypothetical protein DSM112329_03520 [Paraconexibacter sp. AEG42_29]|uniref:EfeO-type cupredoxin-like domain-containing protein n=1 Tax=Paraconexibacter sp. AEG42_29 TaxID=2997339 RepID=A0AAU7AYU1_9ACTN